MIVQCATFSKSLIPRNIDKRISGSVSGSRLKAVIGYPYPVANSLSYQYPTGTPDSDHVWLRVREGGRLAVSVLIWLAYSLCSTAVSQDVSYWKFYLFAGLCFEQYSVVSCSEM